MYKKHENQAITDFSQLNFDISQELLGVNFDKLDNYYHLNINSTFHMKRDQA